MSSSFIIRCPRCGAKNRIPGERRGERARCGKCGNPLSLKGAFPERAITVTDWSFREEVIDFPGPVMMEFYSPG